MAEIRRATMADLPRVMILGFQEFVDEAAYAAGLNFNFSHMYYGYKRVVEDPNAGAIVVAVEDGLVVGFYACQYEPSFMDYAQRIAVETAWYVDLAHRGKGLGKKLLKEQTKLAYLAGIRLKRVGLSVMVSQLEGKHLSEWYERQGYIPFEAVYFKVLTEEDVK